MKWGNRFIADSNGHYDQQVSRTHLKVRGLDARAYAQILAACFPSATPQELVEGHCLHMAIEFSNLFKLGPQM